MLRIATLQDAAGSRQDHQRRVRRRSIFQDRRSHERGRDRRAHARRRRISGAGSTNPEPELELEPRGLRVFEVHRRSRVFRDAVDRSRQAAAGPRPAAHRCRRGARPRARMPVHGHPHREPARRAARLLPPPRVCGKRHPAVLRPRPRQPALFLHRHVQAACDAIRPPDGLQSGHKLPGRGRCCGARIVRYMADGLLFLQV